MKPGDSRTKVEYIEGLLESLRTTHRDAELWANVGEVLLEAGEFEKAVRAYDMALQLDPELHRAHIGLTVALDICGDELAHAEPAKMRSTIWTMLQVLETLVRGLREGRRSLLVDVHAIRLQRKTERLLAANPDDPDALFLQSAFLAKQGRFEEAIASLAHLERQHADHPGASAFRRQLEEMVKNSTPRTARLRK